MRGSALARRGLIIKILAADVAGYLRLMGADEEGTYERLRAHRRELVDPKIEEHLSAIPHRAEIRRAKPIDQPA